MMLAALPLLLLQTAQPPAGIDRDVARQRAELVHGVHYTLAFELAEGAAQATGRVQIAFDLRGATAAGPGGAGEPGGPGAAAADTEEGTGTATGAAAGPGSGQTRGASTRSAAAGDPSAAAGERAGAAAGGSPATPPIAAPLVLDFGGDSLAELTVNGRPVAEPRRVHDHVLLDPGLLVEGRNTITAAFATPVAAAGTPLTVFRDQARGEEFLYTLVVPADAHRLFPCFDQPDLKALVDLELTIPEGWVAAANGLPAEPIADEPAPPGRKRCRFVTQHPLSTYLIAFAAGPFAVFEEDREPVARAEGGERREPAALAAEAAPSDQPQGAASAAGAADAEPALRLLVRPSKRDEVDRAAVFRLHRRALRWLGELFGHRYPFGKLDIVLCPGFPYGGMEHAGAIFYRETALSFDHQPTASELRRRSTLIYHEVSHQWFGNLVTMEWFDDLWLKEGFATFVGYAALAALEPDSQAWLRFHQTIKPAAYRVDATPGTTPVYQELQNLDDAKSAYGAIVYNKAPAVLRELHERLQPAKFRAGVQLFLRRHQFGVARWQDLVAALQDAAGVDLGEWSRRWILGAGMPRVRCQWSADERGEIARFALQQQSVQGGDGTWPLRLDLLLLYGGGRTRQVTAEWNGPLAELAELVGTEAPLCVLPNPRDVAYGQLLLDAQSQEFLLENLDQLQDPLHRAVALSALLDMVREAELRPTRYAELVLDLLARERDPETHAWMLGALGTTLERYLHERDRDRLTHRLVELLLGQLERGAPGRELQSFRALLRASADDDAVLELCEGLLAGTRTVPGLELGTQDRYRALAALLAGGRPEPWASRMTGEHTPPDAEREAFLALAAAPDAATKARYFAIYAQPDQPPEQWMQDSLDNFHWPRQEALTLPYLRPALERVDWVKANRKIFFMPAWVDAFISGHSSRAALETVEAFLDEHPDLSLDIRRKILQSLDGLRRAVAIKETWK